MNCLQDIFEKEDEVKNLIPLPISPPFQLQVVIYLYIYLFLDCILLYLEIYLLSKISFKSSDTSESSV